MLEKETYLNKSVCNNILYNYWLIHNFLKMDHIRENYQKLQNSMF